MIFGLSLGIPGGSDGKASAYNAGDLGSIHGQEDPLEKEMVTHSSTLAWKIPWTEECGRLQSMGSQRSDRTERLHFHFGFYGYDGQGVPKNAELSIFKS